MSNIPIYIGPYEVYTTAVDVLQTHLPDALSAYSDAHNFSLTPPREYFLVDGL